MGVYIKDMEMPKHCMECELAINDNSHQRYCLFTNVMCLNIGVQDDCPLVAIDDELFQKAENAYVLQELRCGNRKFDDAPTIIEGE